LKIVIFNRNNEWSMRLIRSEGRCFPVKIRKNGLPCCPAPTPVNWHRSY